MAIEVSDGFGIVLRAIERNHHMLTEVIIVIKLLDLSKNITIHDKNKLKQSIEYDGSATEWRQKQAVKHLSKQKWRQNGDKTQKNPQPPGPGDLLTIEFV